MPFKCAHCENRHDTVKEARKCAGIEEPAPFVLATNLSDKQQGFLTDLLAQFHCELDGGLTPATITYDAGQPIISALVEARRNKATGKSYKLPIAVNVLAHPNRGQPKERTPNRTPLPDIPEGHYAVPDWTGKNDILFFRIDRPTKGQFAGNTYVKEIVGGRPADKVWGKRARAAIEAIIEFGTDDSLFLYGQQLGKCCHCNFHLTKYASRVLSKGRTCAYKHGQGEQWDDVQASRPAGED